MTTRLRVGSATDTGQVRSSNEDSKLTSDNIRLYAVADGMGGHRGGEVASSMAMETLQATITGEPTQESLVTAVELANQAIHSRSADDDDLRGMGTTLCAIAVVKAPDGGDEIAWANVGDSRIYLFRDDDLRQLSTDHNLVEELRRDGQLTAEEAAVHPQRNIITRALGIDSAVQVDSRTLTAFTGDRFLLCSDGLFNEVSAAQISATMRRLADPHEVAADLVRQANEHGGRDNITCVVVDVTDDGGRAEAAAAAAEQDRIRAEERARERAEAEAAAAAQAAINGGADGNQDGGPGGEAATGEPDTVPVDLDAADGIDAPGNDGPNTRTGSPSDENPNANADATSRRGQGPKESDGGRQRGETDPEGKQQRSAANDSDDEPLPFGRDTVDLYDDLDKVRAKHLTWRVVAFVVALLLVLGVAFGAVGWDAKRTYYVGFSGSQVVVFQGQPGGLLFFHPKVKLRTGLKADELTGDEKETVSKNETFSSYSDARTVADNLKSQVQADQAASTTTTSTTTTAPKATTTTKPAATTSSPPTT